MKKIDASSSRPGRLLLIAAFAGGLALPFSLSAQSPSTYDFEHLTPGPLDNRDGWSNSTSNKPARIYSTEPSGAYMGGNAIGMDGVAGTFIGGRAGTPDFKDATSITADVYLGPHNGRDVRVFGITNTTFTNSAAGIMFGTTGGNNFNIRAAGFGSSTIVSETWGLADTWYRLTLSWSEPDAGGDRNVILYGYDLTNGRPVADNGVILETTVSAAFFGPDPSNYVGFGVRSDGDGDGRALVGSVTHTGRGSSPIEAQFGSVRFINFLDEMTSAPFTLAPVEEGASLYMDAGDTVTALPAALSGKLALKTANDFTGQAHVFDGKKDYVRLEGTREEFQHFLRGEGKASFRVKYDEILARGYGPDRSFFLSANGNIEAGHVDFNVGVSQIGNWWVSLATGAGGQNYAVLEMDITPKPEVGVWYDVEVDLDAGTFSVNGNVLRTFTPANTLPPGSDPLPWQNDFHFGFTPNESRHFHGEMTEVKFEDGAGNITGHWKLNESADFVVTDISGNGHHGTVSGRARPLEDFAPYIGFLVDRPTTVYVAYDENAVVPSWLQNNFTLTGTQVGTTVGGFNLWERDVAAREQVSLLFDNDAWEPGDNNYWVIFGEGPDAITGLADSAFLRTGSTWSVDPYHWTLATEIGSGSNSAGMISSIDNFAPELGFNIASNVRVPRLQDGGDNAVGFILLGDSPDSATGIRAEWLPREGNGNSRLQLVDIASGTVLDQTNWNGLKPTAIDNDVGLADRTDEVLFEEGSVYFTGGPLLAEGFEDGGSGWTSGTYNSSPDQWEIGFPASGPWGGYRGDNVVATRLNGEYEPDSESWLRTPVVDLTDVPDAKLTFYEYMDVDTEVQGGEVFHYGKISVLDASTLNPIQELARYSEDIWSWTEREFDLSDFAGQSIVIEFAFHSDGFMANAGDGWYLDEIQVNEGAKRNIVSMPEKLALDGTLYGLATDNAGLVDMSENYLQFTVSDRSAAGNDGVTVLVAWDARASGLEPDWLRDNFTLTDHVVGVSGGAGHHRLWAREYAHGDEVTLGGASATGAGPFLQGTNNYFVLFADARSGLETIYTLTAEGSYQNGDWTISFSLTDNSGNVQTVSTTSQETYAGNSFGLIAHHPDAADAIVAHAPVWEIFDLSIEFLNEIVDPAGFEAWREEHFAGQLDDPEISGPEASPAGDGVKNLMKYALKLDPWVPASSADLPWMDPNGENLLVLVYWERTDVADIEYIPEVSENLIDWNSGEPHVVKVFGPSDEAAKIQEVEAVGNVTDGAGSGFMRLKVIFKQ